MRTLTKRSGPPGAESTVLIVGASLAGLRSAEALRKASYSGKIVMIGGETELPYDRPPLSKEFLGGTWTEERLWLRSDEQIRELDLDLKLGTWAKSLDISGKIVGSDDGEEYPYDALVIATGASPRQIPGTSGVAGVHVLRTLSDSISLRGDLEGADAKVVIVGAGFIGAEVASTIRGKCKQITVVEAAETPMHASLGEVIGEVCAETQTNNGINLLTEVGVKEIRSITDRRGAKRVSEVLLSDSTVLEADIVVVGIGVTPSTDWLSDSGLQIRNGLVTDPALFAADDVVAAGDLVRWHDAKAGREVRLEHWTNAAEQGAAAARNLLLGRKDAVPFDSVPYVWSDQFGTRIQVIGFPSPTDEIHIVDGSTGDGQFVALYAGDGYLTGAVAFASPRRLMAYHPKLRVKTSIKAALSI